MANLSSRQAIQHGMPERAIRPMQSSLEASMQPSAEARGDGTASLAWPIMMELMSTAVQYAVGESSSTSRSLWGVSHRTIALNPGLPQKAAECPCLQAGG
jgi:hypothetical protein